MDAIVSAAEVALFAAAIVYFGRPWLRARRLGVAVPLVRILAWRLEGVPPDLIVDAYLAQRTAGHELPLAAFHRTWMANRDRITNASELARHTREETT